MSENLKISNFSEVLCTCLQDLFCEPSFFVLFFIVSASRSPPGLESKVSTFGAHFRLAPKRVDSWGSFSLSGGSFVSFLIHFLIIGSTLAALGAHFLTTKTVWTTKGAPRGISRDIKSLFGSHFGVIF